MINRYISAFKSIFEHDAEIMENNRYLPACMLDAGFDMMDVDVIRMILRYSKDVLCSMVHNFPDYFDECIINICEKTKFNPSRIIALLYSLCWSAKRQELGTAFIGRTGRVSMASAVQDPEHEFEVMFRRVRTKIVHSASVTVGLPEGAEIRGNSIVLKEAVIIDDNSGQYRMSFSHGDCFIGKLDDYNCTGKGTMKRKANGYNVIGSFINGVPDGFCRVEWVNGDYYEGVFKHGISLDGTYHWHSDETLHQCKAGFRNGRCIGSGCREYDSSYYIGCIENGNPGEWGTLHYPDGNCYNGELKNWIPEGEGVLYFVSGERFEGTFKDGEVNHGVILDKDGNLKYRI